MVRLTGVDLSLCPECGKGKMVYIEDLPSAWKKTKKRQQIKAMPSQPKNEENESVDSDGC